MVAAGLEQLRDLMAERDPSYLVESIYMAMEYERRRDALTEVLGPPLSEHPSD